MNQIVDEVRPVTALFADIVGSTSLGERLQPEEVKVLIGDCVSRMSRVVEEHGGMVQAYMGDGIAAYFGVPVARDDDADRAALAALHIVREMKTYGQEIASAWGVSDFQVRLGINSGQAGVGIVGADNPGFVALGDMTNVAARLQAAAEPGSIVVGESTARRLSDQYALEPLGALVVKGRSEPVPAWRLMRRKNTRQRMPATPVFGRDAEIARLQNVVAELQAGRGVVLSIRGDAGLGKTCLLREVSELVSGDVVWLEGQCRPYSPLYCPFLEMLRSWLGVEETEAEIVVRTRLRARLSDLLDDRVEGVMPYLGHLLGIKHDGFSAAAFAAQSPDDLAEHVRLAIRGWITALARTSPVVVAIEDMHVADPATCRAVEALLTLTDEAPLLLVVTMRPEPDSSGWAFHVRALASHPHRVVELWLEALPEQDAEELAKALGVSDPAIRALIVARAEGNALYLEELCNALPSLEEVRSRTWTITTRAADLPSPLDALLIAHIDGLSSDARGLVQTAAVIGRIFPASVLGAVAGDEAVRNLPELLRRGVIRERRRYPELEYSFRHGMLQEAALSTLTAARREACYRTTAAAVETLYEDALEERAEILAHYHAQGGDPKAALRYLEIAAERARALGEVGHTAYLWGRVRRVAEATGDAGAEARAEQRMRELEQLAADAPDTAATSSPPPVSEHHSAQSVSDYIIEETLRVEGAVSVHKATAPDGSHVALHLIESHPGAAGTFGRRLFERAQAVQVVGDRHLVSVVDVAELDDMLLIATSWMTGGSLRNRLTNGRLSVAQTTWIVAHVAVGLHAAHEAGVMHGAVTPAAILLDDEDRGALTWVVSDHAIHAGYLAPEILNGDAPGVLGDVYALASTTLACMVGADPPIAPGGTQIPSAGSVGAGVSWVIGAGRAADPAARPRSAVMFAQMLKRAATVAWV
jgi:class 3 adenylate cyclase